MKLLALVAWLGLLFTSQAIAQEKPARGKATPQEVPNASAIPGYQIRKIEGFNVILSDETVRNENNSEYERKPIEVLELELKTVTRLLSPEAVHVLRGLLIWVEWREEEDMSNGRAGGAAAVYYGGHQLSMLSKGKHPLKAKNITILRMDSLTNEHQPNRDSGRCVILHEMTHAVHDQFLGYDNPMVKAGYRQALERKLYDPEMYASTNEFEYFAELTCAYFDQCHYYPRNRAELQKHDPVTYQMMESIWGRRKVETAKADGPTSEQIKLRLEEVDLGKSVTGPSVSAAELKDRPVMILLWNSNSESSLACFQKLNLWTTELADFGLKALAVHLAGQGQSSSEVKQVAESRNVAFPVSSGQWTNRTPVTDFKEFPLCLVFDQRGQCVYRGSPFDVEGPLRTAVGSALVDGAEIETVPAKLTQIVEALRKGTKQPSALLVQLMPHTRSTDSATAEAAKALLAEMLGEGERALDDAESLSTSDPVGAYVRIMRLPTVFKGTTVGTKATTMLGKLKRDKQVAIELQAQPALMTVNKLDAELSTKPGNFDPTQDAFRKANGALLQELNNTAQLMKRSWPNARSTEQAVRTAERYGLKVP
ncbi:MAG: hypothetical protein JSS27_20490 [Planctomycetes bacterium]|nr:hypothetical protein [Planctomycetota bacterium]